MLKTNPFETNEQKIERYRNHPDVRDLILKYDKAVIERDAKLEQSHMVLENTNKIDEKLTDAFLSAVAEEMDLFDTIMERIKKIEAV